MVIKLFIFLFSILLSNQLDVGKIHVLTTNDIHGMIGEQEAAFMNPNFPPTIIGGAAYYKYVRALEKKLPEPREPKTVPEAPPPKPAPASAPLPRWIRTRTTISMATSMWMYIVIDCKDIGLISYKAAKT